MLLILGAGAYYDVREHRIPNWWVMLGIITGILTGILESEGFGGGAVFWEVSFRFFLRFAVVTALFFIFFVCRMIGAGDIKLAALICGYLGLSNGALAVGSGFLIGAFWSLFKMIVKGSFTERFSCLLAYIRRVLHTGKLTAYYIPARDGNDAVIPLGICLFLGTAVYIMYR
ncbi:prepilin peptidase [Lachnospiraceae bacterium 54-53]